MRVEAAVIERWKAQADAVARIGDYLHAVTPPPSTGTFLPARIALVALNKAERAIREVAELAEALNRG